MEGMRRFLLVAALALAGCTAKDAAPRAGPPRGQLANMIDGPEPADDDGAPRGGGHPYLSAGMSGGGGGLVAGPNVRVNAEQKPFPNGLLGRSETTIAASADGTNIVVGWNNAQGFCGPPFGSPCPPPNPPGLSGFGFSTNGGETFTDGNGPSGLGTTVLTRGDPWLAAQQGTFFYANLSVDKFTGADLGVSVHRGRFFPTGFAWFDVSVLSPSNNPNDFYDKEAIAMAQDGTRGVVTVTNFIELCGFPANGFGQIEVWRTNNGGDTWEGPAIAGPDLTFDTNPASPVCGDAGTLQQSSAPAVGRGGAVYVTFQRGPDLGVSPTATTAEIVVARSLNGGRSFDPPVVVATINTMRNNPPVGFNRDRINDHPRAAVATTGVHAGRVFVSFYSALAPVTPAPVTPCPPPAGQQCRGQRLTSSQAFVSHSDDQGRTWSEPVPIAPAPSPTGLKRLWPVVTVSENEVDVVYYEINESPVPSGALCDVGLGGTLRRRGSAHSLVNTYVVRSKNGGASFGAPALVSSATSDWCTAQSNIRPNFGDYIGSTSAQSSILATWGDSRNGPVDTFFSRVQSND